MTDDHLTGASADGDGCDRAADVSAYYDGELPPAPAESLRRHLAECAACRQELVRLETMSAWLANHQAPPASETFLARLPQAWRRRRNRTVLRVTEWAAAVAAAILVAFSALLWRQEPPPPTTAAAPAAWETVAADATAVVEPAGEEGTSVDPDVQIAMALLQSSHFTTPRGPK